MLWSPQRTFESKTVRDERNSIAHPTPSFYSGKTPRLREVEQSTQGHTACQGRGRAREKNQRTSIPLCGYCTRGLSLAVLPDQGPSSPVVLEDRRPLGLKLAEEDAPWATAPTWPCPLKVSSRSQRNWIQLQREAVLGTAGTATLPRRLRGQPELRTRRGLGPSARPRNASLRFHGKREVALLGA